MNERRNTHLVSRFSLLLSKLEGNNYKLFICMLGHYFVVIGMISQVQALLSHHRHLILRGVRLSIRSTLPYGTVLYSISNGDILPDESAIDSLLSACANYQLEFPPPSLSPAKYDGLAACLLYSSTVPPHTPAESTNYKCHTIGLTSSHHSHPSIHLLIYTAPHHRQETIHFS